MAIFDREHEPPESEATDTAYAVVRATLAGVPIEQRSAHR
jgi:hypothetical protein